MVSTREKTQPAVTLPPIRVLLHAHLRHYNQGDDQTTLPYSPGATVADYLGRLAIPGHEYMGVVVNGTLTGDTSIVLAPGSVLELVPAISGG